MRTGSTILAIFFVCISTFSSSDAIAVKKEHTLVGPFEGYSESLNNWTLTGNAQLGPNYIRLTRDEPDLEGGIWNKVPSFSNDWEFQVQFHVHGRGNKLYGDGMAIWYVKEPMHGGPVFGSKDKFSGLGVFIDTFEDDFAPHKHRHPYISAVVNNGSMEYDHDEDGTEGQIGGCHVPIRNLEYPVKIAISHVVNALTVFIDSEGVGQWKPCFRSVGVHLPTGYYYGISASTGDYTDNHDIIAVTTLTLDSPEKEWVDKSHIIPHAEHLEIPFKQHVKEEEKHIEEEPFDEEQRVDAKREIKPEDAQQPSVEEAPAPPASFMRKLVYILGTGIILMIAISMCRKYNAQRRERMRKRLF